MASILDTFELVPVWPIRESACGELRVKTHDDERSESLQSGALVFTVTSAPPSQHVQAKSIQRMTKQS